MENRMDRSLAEQLISAAVAACAGQKYGGDSRQVLDALCQGRCDVCEAFRNHLAVQVGRYLGQIDQTIKAVIKYEPEMPSLVPHALTGGAGRYGGINLIAWVERKSAALIALSTALEAALADGRRGLGCPNAQPNCFTFDLQMTDDRDVFDARGLGLVVNRPFLRSTPIWQRTDLPGAPTGVLPNGEMASIDLELAPEPVLFEQARAIEQLALQERQLLDPHLRELKAILIRRLISDQLAYINIARDWFDVDDLAAVYEQRIGPGKVGGKAAGLLLAGCIVRKTADPALRSSIRVPPSIFLGSDLIYVFMAMNGLMHWNNQKYKSEERIYGEYTQIQEEFAAGRFPPEIVEQLRQKLADLGGQPVVARSSSQLEDNFGTSFAGKYQSFFCPNQGRLEENLAALTRAIALTYASTLNPDALLYRRSKGLQDYDERMAVLIQPVQGERFGRYFLPFGAGVAFSRNLYRWAEQIRREDGFARLVWGLGTHAVERGGNDYPRLVALSHPTLQPDDEPGAICYYSQKYADVIDLEENTLKNTPVSELLDSRYPPLRYLVQIEEEGYLSSPRGLVMADELRRAAVTFDGLLRRTPFAANLSRLLKILEERYRVPVDIEFTLEMGETNTAQPAVTIALLQCRPQSHLQFVAPGMLPADLRPEDVLFSSQYMVPVGYLADIRHVLYVSPGGYFALASQAERREVSRVISQLNSRLPPKTFICVGPGRWGTLNPDLGVFVNYADVYHAGALVELAGGDTGVAPEPSFGTHFFQDLMEAQIYPLALPLDDRRTTFNRAFFEGAPSRLGDWVEISPALAQAVRLIHVADVRPGHHLELYLNGDSNQAIAFWAADH